MGTLTSSTIQRGNLVNGIVLLCSSTLMSVIVMTQSTLGLDLSPSHTQPGLTPRVFQPSHIA